MVFIICNIELDYLYALDHVYLTSFGMNM